jgi:hypothetical protein
MGRYKSDNGGEIKRVRIVFWHGEKPAGTRGVEIFTRNLSGRGQEFR